jgi:hypothetical protein
VIQQKTGTLAQFEITKQTPAINLRLACGWRA